MSTPIILVVGQAGSGKDTVADIIKKHFNAVTIAQADPMKRFARACFDFTEDQLWGPSAFRNALDTRFKDKAVRDGVLFSIEKYGWDWTQSVLPKATQSQFENAYAALMKWANELLIAAAEDGGLTPRKMLQTLGTEWGRTHGTKNMWVDYATSASLKLLSGGFSYTRIEGVYASKSPGYDFVVITDGRFRNEVIGVKAVGGYVFKVAAPDTSSTEVERAGVKGHVSEAEQLGFPNHWFDAVIENDKRYGLESLEDLVNEAMDATFERFNLFKPVEKLIEAAGPNVFDPDEPKYFNPRPLDGDPAQ